MLLCLFYEHEVIHVLHQRPASLVLYFDSSFFVLNQDVDKFSSQKAIQYDLFRPCYLVPRPLMKDVSKTLSRLRMHTHALFKNCLPLLTFFQAHSQRVFRLRSRKQNSIEAIAHNDTCLVSRESCDECIASRDWKKKCLQKAIW